MTAFLVVKSFHIIGLVAWFAGLFYLPRLFVYHRESSDQISHERFMIMERRLYRGIMWPAAILTTLTGLYLITLNWHYYLSMGWMHAKVTCVLLLWMFHLASGHYRKQFINQSVCVSSGFFRFFNELPTVLLIAIVFLVVIRPF